MSLKEDLLNFANIGEQIKFEVLSISSSVKQKADDSTDVRRAKGLIEKGTYDWKRDIAIVFDLAERYNISTKDLKKLWNSYLDMEKMLLGNKSKLESLGLKNVVVGPKGFGAVADLDSEVYILLKAGRLDVKVYPRDPDNGWNKGFEAYSWQLKKDILAMVEK